MKSIFYCLIISFILFFNSALVYARVFIDLRTQAEKTNWKETGRAQETENLCKDFSRRFPEWIQCKTYGKTPEGRNLRYLYIHDPKIKNHESLPTLWVQSGIHAGEIDGKDAVFFLLREIFEQKITPNPLTGLSLAFIPIVNLDGHERFGKWNRPNQTGPEEMGWRTTSQNLNLNRDFAKMDAPEMQALNLLWQKLDPILSVDLHVTDGAQFQAEGGIVTAPTLGIPSELTTESKVLESELMEKLKSKNHSIFPFYPEIQTLDQPLSGFALNVPTPRFSHGYWSTQNRIGILVETHSWKNYATRVKLNHDIVLALLELGQKSAKKWINAAQKLDSENLTNQLIPIDFKNNAHFRTLDFPGCKYVHEKSSISGAEAIRYFPEQPEIWKVPLLDDVIPALSIQTPKEGYLIPPTHAEWISKKLKIHGIKFQELKSTHVPHLQTFRATQTEFTKVPFEGHQGLSVKGVWKEEDRTLPQGTLFIPLHQKNAKLILHLFEPESYESFLAWGFFNAHFEQKEYMEDYVAEMVGKEMLEKDLKIRDEFNARLKSDSAFAKDPKQRLEFFYRKHASWDEQFNLYPIFRY